MATAAKRRKANEEQESIEKQDKVRILVLVGLDNANTHDDSDCSSVEQKICQIILNRENTINFIFSPPFEIDSESAACVLHNDLYTVGVGSESNELWKWSAERDDWTRLADLPSSRRRRHGVTCMDGRIYVLGGRTDFEQRALDDVLCYDNNSNYWTHVSKLCHAVHGAACVAYKHFIYVFGGCDNDDEEMNHVQVYDTLTDRVTLSSNPMPAAHSLMRAVLCGSKALLIGCETCYIYDFEFNSWEERKRYKIDVLYFALTLKDDTLYISGGGMKTDVDENYKNIWTCSDEVRSLSVEDFLSDNQQVEWKHHNKLPFPALVDSFNEYGLEIDASKRPMIDVTYVNVEVNGEMRGMTVVDDRLFVVPSEDPVVNVYDAHSLKSLYAIYIAVMKDPQDLVGCSHNKVLYISDTELKCIHRVIIAGGRLSMWRVREDYTPCGLSVTSEHNLIVALNKYKVGVQSSRIIEYTTDGQVLREIETVANITTLKKAVELTSDLFFCISNTYPCNICVINFEGKIMRSYGKQCGVSGLNKELYSPCSVTLDKRRDRVFLADQSNHRVDMFVKDMTYLAHITSHDYYSGPSRVFFDSSNNRLFIDASEPRFTENPRGKVMGLTVVDDLLYVVYKYHNAKVNVYDSYSMEALPHIDIPGMDNPVNLIGCSHNKALYIYEDELNCIHRINITNTTGERVSQLKVRKNYKLQALSLTSQHNLLVTLNLNYQYRQSVLDFKRFHINLSKSLTVPCRIVEYTSEGEELREIKLDASFCEVWQTIEMNNDQFLICHKSALSVINSEGQFIGSYDSSIVFPWICPRQMAFDKKRKVIFVAEMNKNRVVMYRTDLTSLGHVEVSRELSSPYSVFIDSLTDRLFIGDIRGRVVMCPVKRQLMKIGKQ